ncbi:hypothetical protein ACEN8K_34000 [Variovorax sp. CT11-76]
MGTLTPEERHFFRSDVHARQGERRTRQPHGHITEPARQVPVHERCDGPPWRRHAAARAPCCSSATTTWAACRPAAS